MQIHFTSMVLGALLTPQNPLCIYAKRAGKKTGFNFAIASVFFVSCRWVWCWWILRQRKSFLSASLIKAAKVNNDSKKSTPSINDHLRSEIIKLMHVCWWSRKKIHKAFGKIPVEGDQRSDVCTHILEALERFTINLRRADVKNHMPSSIIEGEAKREAGDWDDHKSPSKKCVSKKGSSSH